MKFNFSQLQNISCISYNVYTIVIGYLAIASLNKITKWY